MFFRLVCICTIHQNFNLMLSAVSISKDYHSCIDLIVCDRESKECIVHIDAQNSFREGSIQSRQHHLLNDINTRISLSKPPKTAVYKHVPNLHWSTKNINIILELAEANPQDYIIDSRDAKTIIPGNFMFL